jgi:8-oxo-dGTP diphosphatase
MIYRISAKGVLREGDKILFIEYLDNRNEVYYSLPGGGQEKSIDLKQTLKNEFQEEVGLDIEVGEVILVREFILNNPTVDIWKNGIHQLEIIFSCKSLNEIDNLHATKPDIGMTGIKWIHVDEFKNHTIYPTPDLTNLIANKSVNYLLDKD